MHDRTIFTYAVVHATAAGTHFRKVRTKKEGLLLIKELKKDGFQGRIVRACAEAPPEHSLKVLRKAA